MHRDGLIFFANQQSCLTGSKLARKQSCVSQMSQNIAGVYSGSTYALLIIFKKETFQGLKLHLVFAPFVENMLRTMPTIVIAHTFCASRDTRISYRRCLLIQGYFCAVQNYAEKAELSKCSWYPKRKLGVTTHFFRDN